MAALKPAYLISGDDDPKIDAWRTRVRNRAEEEGGPGALELFDAKANVVGSMAAFTVLLILRLGGGEPLFGVPALIAYPDWMPFKTVAAGTGMILLPVVSRLSAGLTRMRTGAPDGAHQVDRSN